MFKYKKKFFLFFLTLVLSLFVVGCSSKTPTSNVVQPEAIDGESIDTESEEVLSYEEEPEFLEGEIADFATGPQNGTLTGEVDVHANNINTNTNQATDGGQSVRVFKMIAKQYEFVPNIIKIKKGNRVVIEIVSEDVEHGFNIDEYKINKTIPAGESVTVEFIADKAGVFEFYCSVYCGVGHSNMRGRLVVE